MQFSPTSNFQNPMTTGGDLIYGDSSGNATRLPNGSNGQVLTSSGGTAAPTWTAGGGGSAPVFAMPTVRTYTSGSGNYVKNYTFIITSGSATVGATYTNNAITFTVYATVSGATQVVMNGSGDPAASGTLTKSGGTGDATIAFSSFLYPKYIKIKISKLKILKVQCFHKIDY